MDFGQRSVRTPQHTPATSDFDSYVRYHLQTNSFILPGLGYRRITENFAVLYVPVLDEQPLIGAAQDPIDFNIEITLHRRAATPNHVCAIIPVYYEGGNLYTQWRSTSGVCACPGCVDGLVRDAIYKGLNVYTAVTTTFNRPYCFRPGPVAEYFNSHRGPPSGMMGGTPWHQHPHIGNTPTAQQIL